MNKPVLAIAGLGAVGFAIWKMKQSGVIMSDTTSADQGTTQDQPAAQSSSKLNAPEIAQLASGAGFTGNDLTIAVAVALAESGGDPRAYNPETAAGTPEGLGSYGLWQIYRKVHPEFNGWDLNDPIQNANAAFSIWQSSGWHAWSTFKNARYEAFMGQAQDAVNA